MIWDIVQSKIEAAGIASEDAETYFVEELPADVRVGVMVRSPLSGIDVNPHLPGYYTPRLQVILRHTDPVEGEKLATQIMDVLTVEGVENYPATAERGKVQINVFFPVSLPIRYPRLEGGEIEWSINFRTSFVVQR